MKERDRGIQILRIAACFAVFFCHFGQRLGFGKVSADLYSFSQLGKYGVELFFVVSGYLACFSLSNCKSMVDFYKKRIIRILPLYFFAFYTILLQKLLFFGLFPKTL